MIFDQNNYNTYYKPYSPGYLYNNIRQKTPEMLNNYQQSLMQQPVLNNIYHQIPLFPVILNNIPTAISNAQQYLNKAQAQVYPNYIVPAGKPDFHSQNDLRKLFHDNKSVIHALIMRTFNAEDKDKDGLVEQNEGKGTFLSGIKRLDEVKSLGINTLHLLPIHPPGKKGAMGTAGSIYAPQDYLSIDPKLDDPNNPMNVKEEAKKFIQESHKRGIRVMLDLPSCAAVDLYKNRPDLMAIDEKGIPKIPQGWQDIRMFAPWKDKEKGILNEPLLDMHKKFIDLCLELGVDGVRADVARAKPVKFWDNLINYARSKDPNFAFLAESYTYEDASPIANVPADRPEDLLRAGFDSYYGQYHIFHQWKNAKDFHENMISNLKMSHTLPPNKSLIGSFATHDDKSPMSNGGVPYCILTTGLQSTLPMTNPYFITGFESGDNYIYSYKDKHQTNSDTDDKKCTVHSEMLDIFNYSRKPGGNHPEIGQFMSKMLKLRENHEDVITRGSYIPLKVSGNKEDQIIAYARHLNGKTLLIIANKDVNAKQTGKIVVPTLKSNQPLINIAPHYEITSKYKAQDNAIDVDLGPAGFHMFEIDTPKIEANVHEVYTQNLGPAVTRFRNNIPKTAGQRALELYNKFIRNYI
jgi:glycosidase